MYPSRRLAVGSRLCASSWLGDDMNTRGMGRFQLIAVLGGLLACSVAYCQGSSATGSPKQDIKIPAGRTIHAAPKGQINTYSFFPQIETSIKQKGFKP